jgi:hypothetical protein
MKFGSVSGIRSSLRGRAWKGWKPQRRRKRRQRKGLDWTYMVGRERRVAKQRVLSYPLKALIRRFPPACLAHDERGRRRE